MAALQPVTVVVLIAPNIQTSANAVVRADGATVLAAGHKVEITGGRGLEGIRMELQAGTEAVNLGKLQGDAVGIFAGTLKHSGLINASAVTTEGGKVLLKARDEADIAATVTAARVRWAGRCRPRPARSCCAAAP